MKAPRGLVAILAACVIASGPVQAQTTGRDLVLVVDLSETMVGKAGGTDIFAAVKQTAKSLIADLAVGDTVTLVTFDRAARVQPTVTLLSETERLRLYSAVDDLAAKGKWTYTADGLRASLEEAQRLEQAAPGHQKVVLVLTDGLNNPPPGAQEDLKLRDVTSRYVGKPWFVYQVQLGREVDQEFADALSVLPNARTIHDAGGVKLPDLPQQLPQAPAAPSPVALAADPASVALTLDAPNTAATTTVKFNMPLPAGATAFADRGALPAGASLTAALSDDRRSITLSASATEAVPEGKYAAQVSIEHDGDQGTATLLSVPAELAVTFSPPTDWTPWIIGAGVVLLLTGSIVLWRRRPPPLSGTLEYWPTAQPAARKSEPDLSRFGSKVVIGSADFEIAGEPRAVATLTVARGDVGFQVRVVPADGRSLTMKGLAQADLLLHDADVFQIDSLTFRYRGDTERRISAGSRAEV